MEKAHHILIFGCTEPGNTNDAWYVQVTIRHTWPGNASVRVGPKAYVVASIQSVLRSVVWCGGASKEAEGQGMVKIFVG